MILNCTFTMMGWYFREDTIKKLVRMFDNDAQRAVHLYYTLVTLDVFTCGIFYMLAITAYCRKSLQLYILLMKWIYVCFFT